jgi:predicted dehydrogenase
MCALSHTADNSFNKDKPNGELDWDDSHRMLNLDLGGGAMLDLGIYSLTWIMQILYHLQPGEKETPCVVAAIDKYHTGIDEMAGFVVHFSKLKAMGIGMTGFHVASGVDYEFTAGPAIRIQGSAGEIQILGPAFKPHAFRVIKADGGGRVETVNCPFPKDSKRDGWGHGMYWEADECARCIREKKIESDVLPLDESLLVLEVMESVLGQGGVEYPEHITSDIYDPDGSLITQNS